MKITFEVEKVLKYEKVEVELDDEQIAIIQKYADEGNMTFADAFRTYGDWKGVISDIMWNIDEEFTEYNVWDVEVLEE